MQRRETVGRFGGKREGKPRLTPMSPPATRSLPPFVLGNPWEHRLRGLTSSTLILLVERRAVMKQDLHGVNVCSSSCVVQSGEAVLVLGMRGGVRVRIETGRESDKLEVTLSSGSAPRVSRSSSSSWEPSLGVGR